MTVMDGVIFVPLLPSAACWRARMSGLSMSGMEAGDLSASAPELRTRAPALAQRLTRLQMVACRRCRPGRSRPQHPADAVRRPSAVSLRQAARLARTQRPDQHPVAIRDIKTGRGLPPVPDADHGHGGVRTSSVGPEPRCLVPGRSGLLFRDHQKDALWDRFFAAAPRSSDRQANARIRREGRTPSGLSYSDRKLRMRRCGGSLAARRNGKRSGGSFSRRTSRPWPSGGSGSASRMPGWAPGRCDQPL